MEIDEQSEGMNFISLVKNPATKRPFFTFKKQEKKKVKFSVTNEEKQLLTGVVMLADTPIYRKDQNGEEFFVQFPKEVVEEMAFKYMENKFSDRVNIEHDQNEEVDGVFLVESYLFDEERGIKLPEFLGEVKPGSWVATFKVNNPEIWSRVKKGEFEGFSLEGEFGLKMAFNEKHFDNSLKNSILDPNLSSNQIYNEIIKAVSNA